MLSNIVGYYLSMRVTHRQTTRTRVPKRWRRRHANDYMYRLGYFFFSFVWILQTKRRENNFNTSCVFLFFLKTQLTARQVFSPSNKEKRKRGKNARGPPPLAAIFPLYFLLVSLLLILAWFSSREREKECLRFVRIRQLAKKKNESIKIRTLVWIGSHVEK